MALELGINERPSEMTQHQMIIQSAVSQEKPRGLYQRAHGIMKLGERMWVHILCRHSKRLNSKSGLCFAKNDYSCSLLFRKPSPLAYTPYLHECANSISVNPHQPSDATMIHYLLVLRSSDDVTKSFDHGSSAKMQAMPDERIQVLLKALSRQFNDWKNALPPSVLNEGL